MTITQDSQDIQNQKIRDFVNAMVAGNNKVEIDSDGDVVHSIKINGSSVNAGDLAYFARNYGFSIDRKVEVAPPVYHDTVDVEDGETH